MKDSYMFLAYLSGIETTDEQSKEAIYQMFLAYLSGIETAMREGIRQISVSF